MKVFKQIIIIISLIVIIIIADILTNNMTKSYIQKIKEKLENIEYLIEGKKDLGNSAEELKNRWKEYEEKLSYFLEHDEIEKVSLNINLINKQVNIEKFEDALETIAETKYLLDHIKEKNELKINNIF